MNITKHEGKYYKEVKRAAKAGELVKIVEPHHTERQYTNGDVLTCKRGFENTSILVKEFCYPCIGNSEYVVLEPLTVMTDEPHPEIAEGSTFVVVEGWEFANVGETATLGRNDGTKFPFFRTERHSSVAMLWAWLSPLNIIYKDKPKQETVTIYGYDEFGMPVSEAVPVPGVSKNKFSSIGYKINCPTCIHVGSCPFVEDEIYNCKRYIPNAKAEQPKKRVYMAEQIQEARDIVYRIMTMMTSGLTFAFERCNQNMICKYLAYTCNGKWGEAVKMRTHCPDNEEWNDDIMRLRAICNLTGEPMPSWIRGE